jgi:hypothetical protein
MFDILNIIFSNDFGLAVGGKSSDRIAELSGQRCSTVGAPHAAPIELQA